MWRPEVNIHINKVSSQTTNVNMNQLKYSRWLFVFRLWKFLSLATVLVNIDETCIKYKTKTNYSLIQRRRLREFKASPFSGSINMIFAIFLINPTVYLHTWSTNSNIFKTFGHLWLGGEMIINILAIMKR